MIRDRYTALGLICAVLVLAADQASKYWILYGLDLPDRVTVPLLPVLSLTFVWNRGITFGLFNADSRFGGVILGVLALIVVAGLVVWLRRATGRVMAIAIGAVAGGAVGNVIDRIVHGAVVDFIHAHVGGWSWYVFNVADAAIVCGVIALVLDGGRARPAAARASDLAADPPAR